MKTTLVLLSLLLLAACSPSPTTSSGEPIATVKEIPLPLKANYKNTCIVTGTSSYQNFVIIGDTTFEYKSVGYNNTTCNGTVLSTLYFAQSGSTYQVIYQNVNTYLVRLNQPDTTIVYKLFKRNNLGVAVDVGSDQSLTALQARRDATFATSNINIFLEQ